MTKRVTSVLEYLSEKFLIAHLTTMRLMREHDEFVKIDHPDYTISPVSSNNISVWSNHSHEFHNVDPNDIPSIMISEGIEKTHNGLRADKFTMYWGFRHNRETPTGMFLPDTVNPNRPYLVYIIDIHNDSGDLSQNSNHHIKAKKITIAWMDGEIEARSMGPYRLVLGDISLIKKPGHDEFELNCPRVTPLWRTYSGKRYSPETVISAINGSQIPIDILSVDNVFKTEIDEMIFMEELQRSAQLSHSNFPTSFPSVS